MDKLIRKSGGSVLFQEFADRAVITWLGVPQYGFGDSNAFQIELYYDGRIRLSWLGISLTDGLVGLSDGLGVMPGYGEIDLSVL